MKKIINGKLYDTDTATPLGRYEYGSSGDYSHICETLYQKENGELFLHGVGGAGTRYREAKGDNCWSGGEAILPGDEFDAKDWVSEHCEVEVYIKLFGEVSE